MQTSLATDETKQKSPKIQILKTGGEGEIRTRGALSSTTVFKTVALNHSATSPFLKTLKV